MPATKSHSKERTARIPAVVERAQALILEGPGQSLRKLASFVDVSEPTMRRIAEEDLRYKSYTLKIRQILSGWLNWLSDNVDMFWSKEFWPPNSPDLNPSDYYVWSVVERVTNKSRHPNVTSLRTTIEAAFTGMDSTALQRACGRFRLRIEADIQANGGYIE
ncbi:PREDICTED: uncharacterized protein LOC105557396 [Vollenhovia emeryi]|uniref:uncharacterized protein LOC105557396 n=1 Tax=Vollenhovia emeryi TaxID=411798 RepID=UPI0005F531FA|nr:PREDICTED: uncharacterized protein LOC105557396 [Vollenhovia emeryi]